MPLRICVVLALAVVVSSCAGFKPVDRGEYRRVFAADVTKRSPDAPQEIITREAYEEEVAGGVRRGWEPPPGYVAPLLHETPTVGMKVGDVVELRVDESGPVELFLEGSVADAFWGPQVKRDEWKDGNDVTVRESTLFLQGRKPGKGALRYTRGNETKDVPISVTGP
ncbi:MAG: hypothetical protein AB1938_20500 [Myxococcota bacterium]